MKYLGLDLGSRTLGVAQSDSTGLIASSYTVIRHNEEYDRLIEEVKKLVSELKIEAIVLGFPKNMNNTIGDRAEKSKEFGEMLERRTGLPVVMWDERLTTVSANNILMESKVRREDRKEYVDKVAAVIILQGYLDMLSIKKKQEETE